ncbi:MAG: ATP-binding cassette domain-containing protein [Coriobacteriia bacterium]
MGAALLEARRLRAARPGDAGDVRVLDGIDLTLASGEIVDVVGPSGAGKTTLLLALARLLPSATGELELLGRPASEWDPRAWRATVALLPQVHSLVVGSVADNLLLPWRLKVRAHAAPPAAVALRAALDGLGLSDVAPERDASRLSVGQAARVALLRVLLTSPRVLLLDEPDASLDDASAAFVTDATRAFVEAGGAAVRVRHARVDDAADRRFRLAGGHLAPAVAR